MLARAGPRPARLERIAIDGRMMEGDAMMFILKNANRRHSSRAVELQILNDRGATKKKKYGT
jgi:hypothetical protein